MTRRILVSVTALVAVAAFVAAAYLYRDSSGGTTTAEALSPAAPVLVRPYSPVLGRAAHRHRVLLQRDQERGPERVRRAPGDPDGRRHRQRPRPGHRLRQLARSPHTERGNRSKQVMYRIDIMYKHAATDQEHGDGTDNTQ